MLACSLCSCEYEANYNGKYPICSHCREKISYEDVEYWYCNDCRNAKLRYPGQPSPDCCSGNTYSVEHILVERNVHKPRVQTKAEGIERTKYVERYALFCGDQLGFHYVDPQCNYTVIERCYDNRVTPFRFETREEAEKAISVFTRSKVKLVNVLRGTEMHSANDFYKCPSCDWPTYCLKQNAYGEGGVFYATIDEWLFGWCYNCKQKFTLCVICNKTMRGDKVTKCVLIIVDLIVAAMIVQRHWI